jgi:hypothetical protein
MGGGAIRAVISTETCAKVLGEAQSIAIEQEKTINKYLIVFIACIFKFCNKHMKFQSKNKLIFSLNMVCIV